MKNKKIIIGAVVVLVAILAISGIFSPKKTNEAIEEKVSQVELINVSDYQKGGTIVSAFGQVESMNQVDLRAQVSGNIKKVNVKIGDQVSKDQLLAEIDHDTLDAQLQQASATIDRLKNSLDLRIAGVATEQKEVSQKQVESVQVSYDKAKEAYEDVVSLSDKGMKAKYSYALNSLNDYYIKIYNSSNLIDTIKDAYFNQSDQGGISIKNTKLYQFEKPMEIAKASLDIAKATNKDEDVDKALDDMISALKSAGDGLASVREICNKNQYQVSATDKASIDSQKTVISGSQTTAIGLKSDISLLRSQNTANITAAQARVDSAKSSLDVQKASYGALIADPRQVDLEGIKASVKEAEAAYRLIESNREKAFIKAPFSGTVSNIPLKENNLVTSGQIIASLVNKDGLQVKAYVSEKEKNYIENGASVSFGENLQGVVANISPSINESTKKIEIIIVITSDKAPFTIGEYVESKISTKRDLVGSENFLLPLKAVKLGSDQAYVYIINGETIEEKKVKLGKVINESVEVLEGLTMNDKVVSSVRGIKAGEKVKVKN